MEKLKLKENSYGLRVYCTKCLKQYNYDNIKYCDHPEHQHYKSLVDCGVGRKVKMHQTRNFDEALVGAIQFKKDVKNGALEPKQHSSKTIDADLLSVADAANLYLNYQHDNGVPEHLVKTLSKQHLHQVQFVIRQFCDLLKKEGININKMPFKDLDDHHVGLWYKFFTKKYSQGTWKTNGNMLRAWLKYIIDEYRINMANPFARVKYRAVENNIKAITKHEFQEVIKAIGTASPYQSIGVKRIEKKNHFRNYLANGLKLALYTGLRREEVVALTWKDVFYSEKANCLLLVANNLKVERITRKKYKPKYIPVNPDLMDLLIEMGYDELKGSDLHILEPLRTSSAKTIMVCLSRGFSHYYKQAFPERPIVQFKVLRKTYLSYLNREVGNKMIDLSSHSGMSVLENHYIDQELVTKGLKMRMFE